MRSSAWSLLLVPFVVGGFAADMSFSGVVERVGKVSISIRLDDRRVIDARLPEAPLNEKYRAGDRVEATCAPIKPVYENSSGTYQYLEVTALRLLRHGSPEELERPEAPAPAADPDLERARRINLEYVANMPNFVADETAKRYAASKQSPRWRSLDTVESEITFRGDRVVRQQIRRNGKAWSEPFDALPAFHWYGGFGSEIAPLFDPVCPVTIQFKGRSKAGGRQLLEYDFSAPVDGCFSYFYYEYQRYNPARTGHVFIDESGRVFQLDEEAHQFPEDFEFADREEHVKWDYVIIGAESHLLPVHAEFLVRYASGTRYRIEVEYKNHRHFEASTNLKF